MKAYGIKRTNVAWYGGINKGTKKTARAGSKKVIEEELGVYNDDMDWDEYYYEYINYEENWHDVQTYDEWVDAGRSLSNLKFKFLL